MTQAQFNTFIDVLLLPRDQEPDSVFEFGCGVGVALPACAKPRA